MAKPNKPKIPINRWAALKNCTLIVPMVTDTRVPRAALNHAGRVVCNVGVFHDSKENFVMTPAEKKTLATLGIKRHRK